MGSSRRPTSSSASSPPIAGRCANDLHAPPQVNCAAGGAHKSQALYGTHAAARVRRRVDGMCTSTLTGCDAHGQLQPLPFSATPYVRTRRDGMCLSPRIRARTSFDVDSSPRLRIRCLCVDAHRGAHACPSWPTRACGTLLEHHASARRRARGKRTFAPPTRVRTTSQRRVRPR